jgi:hypothetical protein
MNPWLMEKLVANHIEDLRRAARPGKQWRRDSRGPGVVPRFGILLIRAGSRLAGPNVRSAPFGAAAAGRFR